MVSYLISGASRGLGLAMVERLSKQDASNVIYAGARTLESAVDLKQLAEKSENRIRVIQLDPTSEESVKNAVQRIETELGSLDILINNAGTAAGDRTGILDVDLRDLQTNFDINVIGLVRLTNAALPLLRKSSVKQIIILSSIAGTMSLWPKLGAAISSAYAPTKAGASMVGVHYAVTLKPEGFKVTTVHPGWVRTEMGGSDAQISVEESIDGLIEVFANAKLQDEPVLYSYDGSVLPW